MIKITYSIHKVYTFVDSYHIFTQNHMSTYRKWKKNRKKIEINA